MLGLDAAGKTTVLYQLQLAETVHTIPTVGFNVETVQLGKLDMTIWDIGGQDKIRKLWRHYYQSTHAIVFVVDASDTERIEEAKEELARLLHEDQLQDAQVLVFANKQDLDNAIAPNELAQKLGLDDSRLMLGRQYRCQGCCATTGQGLIEGFTWLQQALA